MGQTDWTQMAPVVAPSPRSGAAMAYDAESDRIILFGGHTDPEDGSVVSNETWVYDYDTDAWTAMSPGVSPRGLGSAGMAYDEKSDRVIMFGGSSSGFPWDGVPTVTSETWAYDYNNNTWTKMSPTTSPSPRCCVSIAYDSQSDRIILHGGYVPAPGSLGDTWAYDYHADAWTERSPDDRPRTGDSAAMAYDADSDRVILFGGAWGGLDLPLPHKTDNETWSFDYESNTWANLEPSPGPSSRWSGGASYSATSDRVVLFGGLRGLGGGDLNDTWAYDFNGNRWTDMNSPTPPSKRCCHAMAYDSGSDRIILFGGAEPLFIPLGQRAKGDTWAYHYSPNLPTAPLSLKLTAGNTKIELRWDPPQTDAGSPILGYHVYRGTTPTDLAPTAELVPGPAFVDVGLTNGIAYYYRVSAVNGVGEGSVSAIKSETPADTLNPTITISSPQEGATLSSTSVTVTGNASDDGVLAKVELSTDGMDWVSASTIGQTWSGTLALKEGDNTIHARATDTAGNTATDSVNVVVQGPMPPPDGLFFIAILAGVTAGVAAGIFLLIRGRRKQ